jgi:large subunit ribosomal protein L35|uniref:Large ribosomal subunit protein bL35 n=1 Tax=candidate division WOR-3 bacterium TaxID=2052148 RepID=A0A7V3RHY5_UNCW3
MSKLKTKRGWAKRVKIKKSGKIMHWKSGKRHLLTGKSRRRKRRLSKPTPLSKADLKRLKGFK